MASFTFVREIAAPPEIVFEVLTDHRGYAEMTPLRKSELEREGEPAPNGVGAIRVLRAVGPPLREEVIAYEPPSRFSYKVLSGLPVRDHVGTVELTAEGERHQDHLRGADDADRARSSAGRRGRGRQARRSSSCSTASPRSPSAAPRRDGLSGVPEGPLASDARAWRARSGSGASTGGWSIAR